MEFLTKIETSDISNWAKKITNFKIVGIVDTSNYDA